MSLLEEIKRLLREYNIRPKRSLGQSFCIDDNLLRRMIAYSNLSEDDIVLEIGSGLGFLTHLLSEVAKQVIAVEIDPKLLKALKNCLRGRKNIRIIPGSILEIKLPAFNKIVANPPYSISSPLIMHLFERSFNSAVLTLQKEFADKLNARIGTRDYGPLAIATDYKACLNVLEHISRDSFYPQPRIESVVVLIKTREPKFHTRDEKLFFRLIEHIFTQRNRKLKKPLESFFLKEMPVSKTEASLIIKCLPFTEKRVLDVKPEEFGVLSNEIEPFLQCRKITYRDHRFYIFSEVYNPEEDTFLLAEQLDGLESKRTLEIGTGCGLLGIMAAEKAGRVVAIDINPYAVKCAKFNAELNHVAEKFEVILGDLFSAFKKDVKFDLIIFNPPYLPLDEKVRPDEWAERAWNGGSDGRETIERFFSHLDNYITENGRLLMVQSSLSDVEKSIKILKNLGFNAKVIAEERFYFEKIVVISAEKLS